MPFEYEKQAIPDVILVKPKVFGDKRGFFMETYKKSDFFANGITVEFNQDNHSKSTKGVLRGLHFQKAPHAQAKLVRCSKGRIYDVAVDIRPNSKTFGKYVKVELSEENKHMLFIPEGFAHGFVALSDEVELLYKASGEYVKYIITELGYKNADGTYSIPDRYIPPAKKTVTLKENVTLSFYFANRLQKTGLIVQKESEDGIISGFYFSVKSDDGKTNKVLVTGADGSAELTNLAVYNTSNKKVKYIVDELGFKNADGTYYFPTKYVKPAAQTVTLEDGKSFVVTMKNLLKRGSVELLKTDGNGNPLEGIEFELYNTKTGIVNVINKNSSIMYEAADSKTADTVTKLVTDSDGRIIVNNLLPGDYYFLETNSKGNMPYAGKINFTISPDSLDTLDIQLTVKNNSVFIPETGGTGNNRPIYIEIGAAVLAFTVLAGAIGLGIRKKKKHIGKKAQQ